jgi:hypothetical protein
VLLGALAVAAGLQCWEPLPPQHALSSGGDAPLLPPHPRLRLNDAQLATLNHTIRTDHTAAAYFEGLLAQGHAILDTTLNPVTVCGAAGADLGMARSVLGREYTLALLYRLTADARFAARAAAELLAVTSANCSTWDPFGLVLAEMTHAVGIGYDWLHGYLDAAQREAIVAGVKRLGFDEALAQYDPSGSAKPQFWTNCTFNWGIVTNGGLTVGGLAFAGDVPNASAVMAKAAVGLRCPFASFAPHGGWHEGSMYWQYVAEYAQAVTEALRGVRGGDGGDGGLSAALEAAPGFNETSLFRLHMNGPSQSAFDFGDSDGSLANSAAGYFMGYAALPTSSPALRDLNAYEGRRLAKLIAGSDGGGDGGGGGGGGGGGDTKYNCSKIDCARLLLGYSAAGTHADLAAQPTARVFKLSAFGWDGRDAVGFFRSAWSAEASGAAGKETWLGFKAANGVPNHNDLDGGTFVFEAGGQRWASDLAGDSYDLPDYFTQSVAHRYGFYRKSTAGHNTLTFGNDMLDNSNRGASDQDPGMAGITEITLFEHGGATGDDSSSSSSPAYAIVELTAAYANQTGAARVQRGFAFSAEFEQLLIVDEIELPRSGGGGSSGAAPVDNVTWTMHTFAEIKAGGGPSAVLSLGGAQLHVNLLEQQQDGSRAFTSARVALAPPQKPSDGLSKLLLHVPLPSRPVGVAAATDVTRIVVGLSTKASAVAPITRPLAQWAKSGPFASGGGGGSGRA